MSGPYDQQQLYAQAGGQFGGQGVGFGAGQAVGFGAGQAVGFSAGQFGGQLGGQSAGQFGGQLVGQQAGQFGGQSIGQLVGQPVGQTVTQTATTTQRSTEVHQTQQQQQQQSSRGDRQRRQRNESSSSSSSSDAGYRAGGAQAAETSFVQGASASGSYAAAGESFGSNVSGQRRQGRYQRQVIRLPDQNQGQVRQVRHRLPTPEPDTLERVYIQRAGQEIVEEITEIPTTPPPRVQERTVVEPAGPPQVIKKVIRVPPRGGGYQIQSQQGAASSLLSAGSYGNVQQASVPYQQFSGVAASNYGGFGSGGIGYGSVGGGYGSFGGGFQQQQQQQAFGFPSQPSYGGASNAYCFYA